MKSRTLLLTTATILAIVASAAYITFTHQTKYLNEIPAEIHSLFLEWKNQYNRMYQGPQEHLYRAKVFHSNYKQYLHEKSRYSHQVIVGHFADLTDEEFGARYLSQVPMDNSFGSFGQTQLARKHEIQKVSSEDRKSMIDWSEYLVAPKRQGFCGACYSFSANASIEFMYNYYNKDKPKISLSEQFLIDCSREFGNEGCIGGLPLAGMEFQASEGSFLEKDYPYEQTDHGQCLRGTKKTTRIIKEAKRLEPESPQEILSLLHRGPVSTCIDATLMRYYGGGIVRDTQDCSTWSVNHGVTFVGFNEPEKYWIIRNSWGSDWGEAGNFKIKMTLDEDFGPCALYKQVSYAVPLDEPHKIMLSSN